MIQRLNLKKKKEESLKYLQQRSISVNMDLISFLLTTIT